MAIVIENVTNPGVEPVDGDVIVKVYPNGAREQRTFHVPVVDNTPPPAPEYTSYEFMLRFTKDELKAINRKAKVNEDIELTKDFWSMAGIIHSDSQLALDSMALLMSEGVIDQARADEILG